MDAAAVRVAKEGRIAVIFFLEIVKRSRFAGQDLDYRTRGVGGQQEGARRLQRARRAEHHLRGLRGRRGARGARNVVSVCNDTCATRSSKVFCWLCSSCLYPSDPFPRLLSIHHV